MLSHLNLSYLVFTHLISSYVLLCYAMLSHLILSYHILSSSIIQLSYLIQLSILSCHFVQHTETDLFFQSYVLKSGVETYDGMDWIPLINSVDSDRPPPSHKKRHTETLGFAFSQPCDEIKMNETPSSKDKSKKGQEGTLFSGDDLAKDNKRRKEEMKTKLITARRYRKKIQKAEKSYSQYQERDHLLPSDATKREDNKYNAIGGNPLENPVGVDHDSLPRHHKTPQDATKTELIIFAKFKIAELDGIFVDMKDALDPFVSNRKKMEKTEEDFKKAVNSLQKVKPKAAFRDYVQALKTKLKKDNIFIKIKNSVVVFGGEVGKVFDAVSDVKNATDDMISAGKGLKDMLPSIVQASEEGVERSSSVDVMGILKREFTNVWDGAKILHLKNAFSDNAKKLTQAPKMVREFYNEARKIVLELFEAFADEDEKEKIKDEIPEESDKKKPDKGTEKKEDGEKGKGKGKKKKKKKKKKMKKKKSMMKVKMKMIKRRAKTKKKQMRKEKTTGRKKNSTRS